MVNDEQLVPITSPGRLRILWKEIPCNQVVQYSGDSDLVRGLAETGGSAGVTI